MACCSKRLVFQILLIIAQGVLVLTQGALLDYYIIRHYPGNNTTYFFFLGDFLCIFVFAGTLTVAYRYLVQYHKEKKNASQSFIYSPKRFISHYSTSKFGVLPMIYISWLFFALLLLGKIAVIFSSDIVDNLSATQFAGPQLLKVAIALSGIIFLILVEGHNWAEPGSPRYVYATSVCVKTGIEILDTVSFLDIIVTKLGGTGDIPRQELTPTLEAVMIALSGCNFLLPALILYKLSLNDRCTDRFPLPLSVVHTLLHVFFIDFPFLGVRLFLWIRYHHNSSIFIMKNVFGIIFAIRGIYPDLRFVFSSDKHQSHVKEFLPSDKIICIDDGTGDEKARGRMEELRQINPPKNPDALN